MYAVAAVLAATIGVAAAGVDRHLGPVLLVALVPLFGTIATCGRWFPVAAALAFGSLTYAIVLGWLLSASVGLQPDGRLLLLIVGGAVFAVQAAGLGVAALGGRWLRVGADGTGGATLLPAATCAGWWVLVEWAWPQVVPFGLGNLLSGSAFLRQAADLFGVHGLSFTLVLVNALLAQAALGWPVDRAMARTRLLLALTVGVALWGYGAWQAKGRSNPARTIKVGVVQGGLSAAADLLLANQTAIARYGSLTETLKRRNVMLAVWPESTLKAYLRQSPEIVTKLAKVAGVVDAPLLVGALDVNGQSELNSSFLVEPGAPSIGATYHKVVLFPFGEYVPQPFAALLEGRWRTTGRFIGGGRPEAMRINLASLAYRRADWDRGSVLVAPSICYEAVLPGWFNDLVRQGAELLINQTDDSWFAGTRGPDLHLDGTRLRAVETRRWLVRASNSGISAIIDPTGETVAVLPYGEIGTLTADVWLLDGITPYVRFGDWIVALSGVLVVVGFVRRELIRGQGAKISRR